jgi:hypothetical protein
VTGHNFDGPLILKDPKICQLKERELILVYSIMMRHFTISINPLENLDLEVDIPGPEVLGQMENGDKKKKQGIVLQIGTVIWMRG